MVWGRGARGSGEIFGKIHIGSYLLIATCALTLLTQRIELDARDLKVVGAILALIAVIGLLSGLIAASGRASSARYLIDTYVIACLGGISILAFPPAWWAALGSSLLVLLVASADLGIAEAALKVRILPYPAQGLTFRPAGLIGHTLLPGLNSALAIGFVAATRWSARAKTGAVAVLLLGAIAAGALRHARGRCQHACAHPHATQLRSATQQPTKRWSMHGWTYVSKRTRQQRQLRKRLLKLADHPSPH